MVMNIITSMMVMIDTHAVAVGCDRQDQNEGEEVEEAKRLVESSKAERQPSCGRGGEHGATYRQFQGSQKSKLNNDYNSMA
jgi:hypothetical protein